MSRLLVKLPAESARAARTDNERGCSMPDTKMMKLRMRLGIATPFWPENLKEEGYLRKLDVDDKSILKGFFIP